MLNQVRKEGGFVKTGKIKSWFQIGIEVRKDTERLLIAFQRHIRKVSTQFPWELGTQPENL